MPQIRSIQKHVNYIIFSMPPNILPTNPQKHILFGDCIPQKYSIFGEYVRENTSIGLNKKIQ